MSSKNGRSDHSERNGADRKAAVETDLMLAVIDESEHNVRKRFDDAELADMAASMRTHGVLVRLLVWQPEKGRRRYELIDGAKRFRAAKLAGLPSVPATVLDTDETGARELMLIATVQRSDPTALELADSYHELIARHGYTVETLAERIGKSPATVRDLVKIARQLPPLARAALDTGRIVASTAGLIARVPGEAARDEAARFVLSGWSNVHGVTRPPTAAEIRSAEQAGKPALGFAATKELIAKRFMVELKQAPFDQLDDRLCPEAGSCRACPKCTGNNREEYPDSRADICTDPGCYQVKVKAQHQRALEQYRDAGRTVLPKKDSLKLFYTHCGELNHVGEKYVDLAATCYDVNSSKAWRKVLDGRLDSDIVIAVDHAGVPHELVPRAKAMAIARKEKHADPDKPKSSSGARIAREQAALRAKHKAGKAAALLANAAVAAAAERMFAAVVGFSAEHIGMLRALAAQVASAVSFEACALVVKRRGGAAQAGEKSEGRSMDHRLAACALAQELTSAAGAFSLIAELAAAEDSSVWGRPYETVKKPAEAFRKAWGIDKGELLKDASAERKQKKSAKTAAKERIPPIAPDSPAAKVVHDRGGADPGPLLVAHDR